MSTQRLETWAAKHIQSFPLSILDGTVLGIDATYYLDQCLNENTEEPLKVALGGLPFCLTARIEEDIQAAKDAGIKLLFVFNGLDYVNKTPAGAESIETRRAHDEGWSHYMAGDPKATVADLGKADYPLELVSRSVQKVLSANQVDFLVAPFSSLAFLSYLYHPGPGQSIDAVMASSGAFLFDVDKIILSIDSKESAFSWLKKADCETAAGSPQPHMFKDAQLMLGSSFLPPFPLLPRNATIRDSLNLLTQAPLLQLCHRYREDPNVASLKYADRYKKAIMTIRHHIIMTVDGTIQPLDFERAPGDVHVFVGQRLPDELIFYISRGFIAPHIPNWLTTANLKIALPGGAFDCEPFRNFVVDQLNTARLQPLKILAESLHNYYQNRELSITPWTGRDIHIKLKELPLLKDKTAGWRVRESLMPASRSTRTPSVLSCLHMLKDKDFASQSITKGRVDHPALTSQTEILANVFWRFLHIRGFVDDKHQLTQWGVMLEAALSSIDGGSRKEEQAILAIELLRMGAFNTQSITGTNVSSTDKSFEHKSYTNLLTKIACLGRLKHEPVGYVGPLDRSLLTYAWEITFLRSTLRDLVEAILTSMFLNGDAARDRDDWQDLPQHLPFVGDNGAGLGIAVKVYLDALNDKVDSEGPLDTLKERVKSQGKPFNWFSKVEGGTIHKSLDTAFKLFDVVYVAVQAGEKEVKDSATFKAANEWLSTRR